MSLATLERTELGLMWYLTATLKKSQKHYPIKASGKEEANWQAQQRTTSPTFTSTFYV